MNRKEIALGCFQQGFSCSQAVFAAFADDFGMDTELAFRVAAGFGGGMGRLGETCGTVTGAVMVIGMKYGAVQADDPAAKERTYAAVQDFVRQFKERHACTECRELLECDLGTPEGLARFQAEHLKETRCVRFVEDAVEILERLFAAGAPPAS
jgi:C_GCAxxG_C_C family probable redox protein